MYTTVEEADLYIQEHYTSDSEITQKWGTLSTEDKEVLLRNSSRQIDLLPLTGRPLQPPAAFPRTSTVRKINATEIPQAVKDATVLLAINVALQPGDGLEEERQRAELRRAGVKSYRIGKFSESFSDLVPGLATNIVSNVAVLSLLQPWLGGSFRII
jgi:hypothetical protein